MLNAGPKVGVIGQDRLGLTVHEEVGLGVALEGAVANGHPVVGAPQRDARFHALEGDEAVVTGVTEHRVVDVGDVQGVEAEVMEGNWQPERVVILEFPSKDVAKGFLEDPEAQPLFALRHDTTDSKLILVEGCF